jgi:replicative DNA helicase
MFVYREQYYLERTEPTQRPEESDEKYDTRHDKWKQLCQKALGRAEIIIAKQRHGPIGTRNLTFDGPTTKFSDYQDADFLPDDAF